ncbi:uncharacterized protein BDV14DRAFT_199435 [Aspergillus stella-maris]|uniref:uncharacterized protein n=1 Tax=Aspergillus stella-maris TaxID=1810926 RepID=UPI003CCD81F9
MFNRDIGTCTNNPLDFIDSNRMMQLIGIWFSVHPFSVIISKNLLLQSISDGVHDRALLAILLAEAMTTLINHVFQSNRPSLLVESTTLSEWSISQIAGLAVNSGNISTAQTLLFLGWHYLHHFQARRALSCTRLAAQIINNLRNSLSPTPNVAVYRSQINGFQIIDVEHEVLQNIESVASSLQLWMPMQMENGQSQVQSLPDIPACFPSVDVISSRLTVLDVASGHISTIREQGGVARLLWPLSQLTATFSHICILADWYRNTTAPDESIPAQTRHLYQLRDLVTNGLDKESLCSKIRLCLQGALSVMQEATPSCSLEAVVKVTYLSIMVYMLFPNGTCEDWTLTEDVLGNFLTHASSPLRVIISFTGNNPFLKTESSGCYSTAAEIFALGLGTCVRAMRYINSRQVLGWGAEQTLLTVNSANLLELLIQMRRTAKSEIIMQTKRSESILHTLEAITLDTDIACLGGYGGLQVESQKQAQFIVPLDGWSDYELGICSQFPLAPESRG